MKKKRIVFILGAGSSKDFGLPLGNELFSHCYEILKNEEKNDLTDCLQVVFEETETHMRTIFINLPDDKRKYPPIEEVLTFLWDYRQRYEHYEYNPFKFVTHFSDTKNGARDVFDVFVRMIGLTLECSMFFYCPKRDLNEYRKFIKSLDFHKNDISFISLNYDLIIDSILEECVAENIINDYSYGLGLKDLANAEKHCRTSGVLLLKPHGSLNLAYREIKDREGGFYYSQKSIFSNPRFHPDGVFSQLKKQEKKTVNAVPSLKPLIIPPLFNKADYIDKTAPEKAVRFSHKSIYHSPKWYRKYVDREISMALGNADEIIVIGYSMPAYDFDFKSLLLTGLMSNPKRDKVCLKIITKGNESQIENLKLQYQYLIGSVSIEGKDGFCNYLRSKWGKV